jgi:hypothetical protein
LQSLKLIKSGKGPPGYEYLKNEWSQHSEELDDGSAWTAEQMLRFLDGREMREYWGGGASKLKEMIGVEQRFLKTACGGMTDGSAP